MKSFISKALLCLGLCAGSASVAHAGVTWASLDETVIDFACSGSYVIDGDTLTCNGNGILTNQGYGSFQTLYAPYFGPLACLRQ